MSNKKQKMKEWFSFFRRTIIEVKDDTNLDVVFFKKDDKIVFVQDNRNKTVSFTIDDVFFEPFVRKFNLSFSDVHHFLEEALKHIQIYKEFIVTYRDTTERSFSEYAQRLREVALRRSGFIFENAKTLRDEIFRDDDDGQKDKRIYLLMEKYRKDNAFPFKSICKQEKMEEYFLVVFGSLEWFRVDSVPDRMFFKQGNNIIFVADFYTEMFYVSTVFWYDFAVRFSLNNQKMAPILEGLISGCVGLEGLSCGWDDSPDRFLK